jgi:hypothetical protein
MKVKELITLLRIEVPIEFRIDNYPCGICNSNHLLAEKLADYEIADWFVCSNKHSICINLKEKDDAD